MLHDKVRPRPSDGPAILSYGFRPFFFFGALYAALNILLWLPFYFAETSLPIVVSAVDWHVHELIFGVMPAIIAGFLLTAIPNWTGRLPVKGTPLLLLVSIWFAGRIAFNLSAYLGLAATAFVDCAFLVTFFAAAATEIVAGKNWRNLRVLVIVGALTLGHIGYYFEIAMTGEADIARRVGIAAITLLIMLIGGRIIPSFTRNWLARMNPGRLPTPFGNTDKATLAVSVVSLAGWSFWPENQFVGYLLLITAFANLYRLSRWAGDRTAHSYILLVLHLAYLFLPIGFALLGAGILWPEHFVEVAGIHAIGMGGFGAMVLGVMVRATRGHTGHDLSTDLGAKLAFTLVLGAAALRVLVALQLFGSFEQVLLRISQLGWCAAFLCFAIGYAPKLWQPRRM
ncbi:NnrS family protein [Maritalea porphyrae]|uniref:Short-chain dehydrogenase n=1 Tax=Maritalea porphyrae TaxID=880732 RepID=A0ABQ5UUR5_9HYPH|nr:NnrS family protein [Maritalea porphyrae]GLQ19020.1 short-chain dehydrogenase [Maritalea porphyrae]